MAKKTAAPKPSAEFEAFAIEVKTKIGEASDEVLQAWFDERVKADKKKPAETPPAE